MQKSAQTIINDLHKPNMACTWVYSQCEYQSEKQHHQHWDFPGGPVAKIPSSQGGGPGSIPGRGTRSHMPQLRVHMLQRRHNTAKITKTKTQHIACTFSYNFPRWAWSELLAPQGVLLHVWLLLLNVMFVKFIHIVGYICRSSIFSTIGRYSSNKCANIYLFYCWRAFG